jgi:hypothetical protein
MFKRKKQTEDEWTPMPHPREVQTTVVALTTWFTMSTEGDRGTDMGDYVDALKILMSYLNDLEPKERPGYTISTLLCTADLCARLVTALADANGGKPTDLMQRLAMNEDDD